MFALPRTSLGIPEEPLADFHAGGWLPREGRKRGFRARTTTATMYTGSAAREALATGGKESDGKKAGRKEQDPERTHLKEPLAHAELVGGFSPGHNY